MTADFKDYIGIKHIKAKPATWLEAQLALKRPVSEKDPAPDTPGYLVQYKDGYLSWSPKDIFDESHFDSDRYYDALDELTDLYYRFDW